MRIWLSRNSAITLRDQLTTQLMLGVVSEELKAGQKLPSVRELAHRYHIHPNTVSAAYRDLAAKGWLDFKKGSGVFVRDLRASPTVEAGRSLDELIESFLEAVRARGFSLADVRARFTCWLDAVPVRRLIVVEPEPELCEIVVAEVRERLSVPVTGQIPDGDLAPAQVVGAAVTGLVSRAQILRAVLPPTIPHLLLRLRSVPEYLYGQERPTPDALIAVASASPEILRRARTILAAAALDADAIEFRDAREDSWQNGLPLCQFVITDVVTAPKIPARCKKRIIRVIADASIQELERFVNLVTDQEVS